MTREKKQQTCSRTVTVVAILFLFSSGIAALAGSATRTRPSGGSGGSSAKPSASTAGPSRPGGGAGGSAGGTTRVGGRARYGYGHGGYRHGGYAYYPGGWYGGYDWYGWPYGYGFFGPYGYGWYGPYIGPRQRMITVAVSPDRNAPAVLETDILPKKAHLFLDGDDLGKVKYFNGNWDRLPLQPGRYKLEFRAAGYRTLRVEMDVEAGRFYRLDYRMEKGAGEDPRSMRLQRPKDPEHETAAVTEVRAGIRNGLVRIRVNPADAAVYLDGEFLGRGDELARLHGALPVAAGMHRIEVVRPGYVSRTVEVEVTGQGDPTRIELELEKD